MVASFIGNPEGEKAAGTPVSNPVRLRARPVAYQRRVMREVAELLAVDRVVVDGGHLVEQPQVLGAVPGLREIVLVEQVPVPEVGKQEHARAMPGLAVRTNQNGRRPEFVEVVEPVHRPSDFAQVREGSCLLQGLSGLGFFRPGRSDGDDLGQSTDLILGHDCHGVVSGR